MDLDKLTNLILKLQKFQAYCPRFMMEVWPKELIADLQAGSIDLTAYRAVGFVVESSAYQTS